MDAVNGSGTTSTIRCANSDAASRLPSAWPGRMSACVAEAFWRICFSGSRPVRQGPGCLGAGGTETVCDPHFLMRQELSDALVTG